MLTFTTGLFTGGFIGIIAMSVILLSSQEKYINMKTKGERHCGGRCK